MLQRLRRSFSSDKTKAPAPEPADVQARLVAALAKEGCTVVINAGATAASSVPSVPALDLRRVEVSAAAPDVERTARELAHSWRHGREIHDPEVKRSPSREHLIITFRCPSSADSNEKSE